MLIAYMSMQLFISRQKKLLAKYTVHNPVSICLRWSNHPFCAADSAFRLCMAVVFLLLPSERVFYIEQHCAL